MCGEHCGSGGRELTVQVTVRTLKPVPHVTEQAPHGLSAQYAVASAGAMHCQNGRLGRTELRERAISFEPRTAAGRSGRWDAEGAGLAQRGGGTSTAHRPGIEHVQADEHCCWIHVAVAPMHSPLLAHVWHCELTSTHATGMGALVGGM